MKALERKPELIPLALESVFIGVSSFFRDETVFEELRRTVIPGLVKERGGLRVCSVGCSEGQELYSVAMLLDELGGLNDSHLLGLDCRPKAISGARGGSFEAAELEGVPAEFRDRYFSTERAKTRIAPCLRERPQWQEANCLKFGYGTAAWDVILFRNLAIYFRPEEITGMWEQLVYALTPGGVLVTGKAEQPPNGLPVKRICHCIYTSHTG